LAGIYIHIPFCKQACYYCNFYFSTSLALKEEIVNALITEVNLRSEKLKSGSSDDIAILSSPDERIQTIYFGGGTPSVLTENELNLILSSLKNNYIIDPHAEITLEANPDDITTQKLNEWKNAGINRLSIGIQSFIDRDLKWMNRVHDSQSALNCIKLAREAGFNNLSVDLIFGTPGLSNEEWQQTVATVIDLDIPHIACYALTVEPKTALQKMIVLGKKEDINSDVQAAQFALLMQMMHDAGYEHYEISNFAKPGFRSKHNSGYWQGEKYIGIGPSAHSYDGKIRSWNRAHNVFYIKSLLQNIIPFEKEVLTEKQKVNEYIMTSLRTIEGMDLYFIQTNFSLEERKRIETLIHNEIEKKMFFRQEDRIYLSDEGKLFADRISVKLFA
jgi:oxygen-independent coproporphyrinogen-3 oxidase